jgi:CBS domain-containing protein
LPLDFGGAGSGGGSCSASQRAASSSASSPAARSRSRIRSTAFGLDRRFARTSRAYRRRAARALAQGTAVLHASAEPRHEEGRMSDLSEILAEKGRQVHEVDAETTVFEAIKQMVEANVGSVLVTDRGSIVGIFTERDYLRRVALEGRSSRETAVHEIMTTPVVVATPETAVDECMALMTDRRIRHVPVVENDEVVGIVSIGDLVKFTSRKQSFEIQYLHDFISAR